MRKSIKKSADVNDTQHCFLTIQGRQHKIKLIPLTKLQRDRIKNGDFIIAESPDIWAGNQQGEIFEGFFDNITGAAGSINFLIERPEALAPTHTRHKKNYLVWFETNRKTIRATINAPFLPEHVDVLWNSVDLDEDSQSYDFCSVTYPGASFDEQFRSVDEGFFLLDRVCGILDVSLEETDEGFRISE